MHAPGSILQNRYRIVRTLGHGGMGTVYEAIDQRLNCVVALKKTAIDHSEEARWAFEREASLLGNLRHAALPKVMDYFTEDRSDFLVMEFIPGDDLAELLKKRESPFPQAQVLYWAKDILQVLEYLHGQNPPILHRDIKPSNLKVTQQGELFLLDFGLAKGAVGQMPTLQTSRSVRGYTPVYASLEQILGQGTDPRGDLYSLGATLYHLITARPPIAASTRFSAIEDGGNDPLPPIKKVNPAVTIDVDVIHRSLAINRRNRPGSAAEMRAAVEHALRETEPVPINSPIKSPINPIVSDSTMSIPRVRSGRRTYLIGIVALVATMLIGGAALWFANIAAWLGKSKDATTAAIVLTAPDMTLIAEDQPAELQKKFATDESARRAFAKDILRLLAVAEEARRAGFADRANIKRQMHYAQSAVISELYYATHNEEVTDAEIEALFRETGRDTWFEELLADAKDVQKEITAESKADLKKKIGKILIGERRGVAAGLQKTRKVELKVLLQRARVLAQLYATEVLQAKMKPTEAEIDAYISTHPDLDDKKYREQAEAILKQLREGEDFAKSAKQYSTDGSRDKGGDLGWFGRGQMVQEFENAAYSLQPGQISEVVKTQFGYHIIKLEDRRTIKENGVLEEQVRARHILISEPSANPFEFAKSPRDRAREALETEKAQQLLDEIASRSTVIVPQDFSVGSPSSSPVKNP